MGGNVENCFFFDVLVMLKVGLVVRSAIKSEQRRVLPMALDGVPESLKEFNSNSHGDEEVWFSIMTRLG